MPTYQYECTSCDYGFEVVQSFADTPLTDCPQCGKSVRKVYSNVGIVFKGSGFYKTDSRSKSESPSSSTASTPAAPAKTESKSESKTESKKESSSS